MYAYERTKTPNGPANTADLADRLRPVVVVAEPLAVADDRRHRQERLEVVADRDRPSTRPASAVRLRERLMQVEVDDSKPMSPGCGVPEPVGVNRDIPEPRNVDVSSGRHSDTGR